MGRREKLAVSAETHMYQWYYYDLDGQVSSRFEFDLDTEKGNWLFYTYDSIGQLRRVTQHAITSPLADRTTCFLYGNDHRLLELVRPDGVRVRQTYDGEGRLLTVE